MITERFTRNCNKVEAFKWGITRMQPNGIRDKKEDAPQNSAINKIWLMGKSVVLHQENNIKCQYGAKTPIHRVVTYNRTHGNALTHSCNTKIKQSPRLRFAWENPKAFARCNVYWPTNEDPKVIALCKVHWPTNEDPKSLLCAKFID